MSKPEYIGNLVAEGFMSGYYPYWILFLTGIDYNELSEATLEHISQSITDGYIEGEVIENYKNRIDKGWWRLQI